MNFLADPNFAYLVLLGGILVGLLAIVTPGTGLLELGGFALLALTAYELYSLPFRAWAAVLLAAGVLPFFYAIQRPRREPFLALAILMLVTGSALTWKPGPSLVLVLPAGLGTAAFLWVAVRKTVQASAERPAHRLGDMAGAQGEARTEIHREGSVLIEGEMWSARSAAPIPQGSPVRVLGREGFVLIVEKKDQ